MPLNRSDKDCHLCKYRIGSSDLNDLWLMFDEDEGVQDLDIHIMCLLDMLMQLEDPEACTQLKVQTVK
jgi:hypothetical protein|tara:strand:+ start:205 stop:408 length:204 start_codon:yes stop_codon:yes gene_type:complete